MADKAPRGSARNVLDYIDALMWIAGRSAYVWWGVQRGLHLNPPVPVRWSDA